MAMSAWDSVEIAKCFSDCATLGDVIFHLENEHFARGEVICEIRVNGMILKGDEEGFLAASRIDEIKSLSIETESPDALICGALDSALDLIPNVQASCIDTAEQIRLHGRDFNQRHLTETIDGAHLLVETLMHIRGASEGMGLRLNDEPGWKTTESKLVSVVKEVLLAYQRSDLVLVADLLEYEVTNSLDSWKGVLESERKDRGDRGGYLGKGKPSGESSQNPMGG